MGWSLWHPDWEVEMRRYAWRGERMVEPYHGQEIRGVVVEDVNGKYHAGVRHGLMPNERDTIIGIKPEWTGKTEWSGGMHDDKAKAIEAAKRETMDHYKSGLARRLKSEWKEAQVRREHHRDDLDRER
jgi:hypothetical protein